MADDIKLELERKREKLRLLREEKLRRAAAAVAPASVVGDSSIHSTAINSITDIDEVLRSLGISKQPLLESSSITTSKEEVVPVKQHGENERRKLKPVFNALKVDIPPPPDIVVYAKETQTALSDHEANEALQWDDDEIFRPSQLAFDEPIPAEETDILLSRRGTRPGPEECEQLLHSAHFSEFITGASRVLERILASNNSDDEFIDYRVCLSELAEQTDEDPSTDDDSNRVFRQVHVIQQPNVEEYQGAIINSIDWSTSRPELLLASYGEVGSSSGPCDSQVLVWNQRHCGVKTPEFTLTCHQSPVTCAMFSPYQRSLIFGGTYGGQIVIWDVRTGKSSPVQRSMPSGAAHLHPVYALRMVGSENAYSLVSVSTDGKMCTWRPDMVVQPIQETLALHYKHSMGVAATCLDFPPGEVNKFVVGSEEYTVYTGLRHGSQKTGIVAALDGHHGQVTAVSCHRFSDWSDLVLSSSLDWTVCLWNVRDMSLVHSFTDSTDYVFDVQWSPQHPAVFVSGNSGGKVSFWDLSQNTESPIGLYHLPAGANRLAWQCQNNKQHLAVGTDRGSVHLFAVSDSASQPKADTGTRFNLALRELKKGRRDFLSRN